MNPDDYIPPRPIPVTERLPQPYDPNSTRPQDCDPLDQCWLYGDVSNDIDCRMKPQLVWILAKRFYQRDYAASHWLPWWAIPLPPEVES